MQPKINHMAIVCEGSYAMAAQFYQAVFGLQPPPKQTNFNSSTVGDGYVGLNLNPRRPNRAAGLDHFGIEVDDIETAMTTLREKYPEVQILKRMSNRNFASYTTHDPDGNIFDLSQRNLENRGAIYTELESGWTQKRTLTHFGIRTLHPEAMARFYADAFGFTPSNRTPNDPNYYLSDGRVTLTLMPWSIMDFAGTGIVRTGPHHIGIKVESLAALQKDLDFITAENPDLAPKRLEVGPEGEAISRLFQKSVPYATLAMADNTGVLVAVSEG
jgi:catechol 2,3-dioxygenase-like lactoylglutathione lyase family enzyme